MGEESESIGGLFARLADDAGTLVRAEVELYRAKALHRLALSQRAIMLLASALLIAQAAVACLLVMLAIALSRWIGPIGAGIAIAAAALAIAALLARTGLQRLSRLNAEQPGDPRP
jgi:alkylhydroperoxidase/carboxymuconolactone decarboxylase family protein YurZ